MARIRTIKPEFWTDEKIIDLPYEARLLFIGIWNFCDDEGYLWDEPSRIKMQVLPNDEVDASGLVDLLVAAGFLETFITDEQEEILHVSNFADHQRVSNPAPSRIAPKIYKKSAISLRYRRLVAKKYGCEPGCIKEVGCYYCGASGLIHWWPKKDGQPGSWVSFSRLQLDHLEPEKEGNTEENNLVLACKSCNASKKDKNIFWFVVRTRDSSRAVRPERNGIGIEKVKEQEQITTGASAPLPDWIPNQTWTDFVEMRKKLRKPLTTKAAELIIAKLATFRANGHDPETILNNSIENSWQGVFEPKGKPNGISEAKPSYIEQRLNAAFGCDVSTKKAHG